MKRTPSLLIFALLAAALPAAAHAQAPEEAAQEPVLPMTYTCVTDYSERVFVDANQVDWEAGVKPTERVQQLVAGEFRYDWTGPNDASFMLWCRESDHALYFAVIGRDNELKGPHGSSAGDRMEFFFDVPQPDGTVARRAFRVPVYPAAEDATTQLLWLDGGPRGDEVPAGRADVVARQHGNSGGFFLELMIPRTALNTEFDVQPLGFAAVYRDIDGDQSREKEVGIATAPFRGDEPSEMGTIRRGLVDQRLADLRRSLGVAANVEPEYESYENVGGTPAKEYVAVFDNHIVVLGNGLGSYNQAAFPAEVAESQKNLGLEFRDLDLDGDMEFVHRFSVTREDPETGKPIEQRIAGLYDVDAQGINRFGHQEYAVTIPGVGSMESAIDFVRRPDLIITRFRRPRRSDLTRESFIDVDADIDIDYYPSLLPWDDELQILYYPMRDRWHRRVE